MACRTPPSPTNAGNVLAVNAAADGVEWVAQTVDTDTHDVTFPGLPTDLFIYDGDNSYADVGFHVRRNGTNLTVISTGTPGTNEAHVSVSNNTGLSVALGLANSATTVNLTNPTLAADVPVGERRAVELTFTIWADDGVTTYTVRHDLHYWKVDTADLSVYSTPAELNIALLNADWNQNLGIYRRHCPGCWRTGLMLTYLTGCKSFRSTLTTYRTK